MLRNPLSPGHSLFSLLVMGLIAAPTMASASTTARVNDCLVAARSQAAPGVCRIIHIHADRIALLRLMDPRPGLRDVFWSWHTHP